MRFHHLGLTEAVGSEDIALVQSAAALIEEVPDLAAAVGAVARSMHVLRAEEGYDVSHSEPTIPFSIFVSIPGPDEKESVIRLAESIIHEAMHLQLTLLENVLPLIAAEGEGFSPWQRRNRPARGLLHGLYVFSAIIRFMDLIAGVRLDLRDKARKRRTEIEEEVAQLGDFQDYLTDAGATTLAICLNAIREQDHLWSGARP